MAKHRNRELTDIFGDYEASATHRRKRPYGTVQRLRTPGGHTTHQPRVVATGRHQIEHELLHLQRHRRLLGSG